MKNGISEVEENENHKMLNKIQSMMSALARNEKVGFAELAEGMKYCVRLNIEFERLELKIKKQKKERV